MFVDIIDIQLLFHMVVAFATYCRLKVRVKKWLTSKRHVNKRSKYVSKSSLRSKDT
jgi:hypothetical protein